ncbi:MAG: hypothetical protein JWQ66_2134 [Mucilaginibacter sp.]|nr:hypothetical protein [Mucilaginibacter sp.]
MTDKISTYSLRQIADWQLQNSGDRVELPSLQRGFVWKTHQIESLWDSLLRGYPIGALLLSESSEGDLFLMDGQQRATSIALGFYNPWMLSTEKNFWSLLSRVPTVWIDLDPVAQTSQHKFLIRALTTSHPWGYQIVNHQKTLSVSDRRQALTIMRNFCKRPAESYLKIDEAERIPYDSNCPVPLVFLIEAIWQQQSSWKNALISSCKQFLSPKITTKHADANVNYTDHLTTLLERQSPFIEEVFHSIKHLQFTKLPGLRVDRKIVKGENEILGEGEDPTLFVRLNSSGTRIAGEELIYSIYKASFPQAKDLVESIGSAFMPPSLVITLVSRLVISEMTGNYPPPLNVRDFIKRLEDNAFYEGLKSIIGGKEISEAKMLFSQAFEILEAKDNVAMPPVLVKKLIQDSPDLFLMLLRWVKNNSGAISGQKREHALGGMTALAWFGRNNVRFVRESWIASNRGDLWTKAVLQEFFIVQREVLMYPVPNPVELRNFLIGRIANSKAVHESLSLRAEDELMEIYDHLLKDTPFESDEERLGLILNNWSNFIWKLKYCKPLLLFAQRDYINNRFPEYNQLDDLEDTNAPWDWDHIYPSSWVYMQRKVDDAIRQWNNTIGNYRALSIEDNRSQGNHHDPASRLEGAEKDSFILASDQHFWSKITGKIEIGEKEKISDYLHAVIWRMLNIYECWYQTLRIQEIFDQGK